MVMYGDVKFVTVERKRRGMKLINTRSLVFVWRQRWGLLHCYVHILLFVQPSRWWSRLTALAEFAKQCCLGNVCASLGSSLRGARGLYTCFQTLSCRSRATWRTVRNLASQRRVRNCSGMKRDSNRLCSSLTKTTFVLFFPMMFVLFREQDH
jgi:hypothetical protein